jgi:hypothetical protein
VAGTGTGAEETGTETQAGEAAPEALEEVITIDVQVCMVSIRFRSQSSQRTERDKRDYRYDDRRDSDRRDRDDRRRDDRRDDRHRDDPRGRDAPKNPEARPSPGVKEESGEHRGSTASQDVNSRSSPSGPRTTHTE